MIFFLLSNYEYNVHEEEREKESEEVYISFKNILSIVFVFPMRIDRIFTKTIKGNV